MKKLLLFSIMVLFVFFGLSSCTRKESNTMDEYRITVHESGQITYKDLKIGIGAIEKGQYIDESGKERRGKFLKLFPFLRDEEKGRPGILAYEGFSVEINQYVVTVLDIKIDSVDMYIYEKDLSDK